MKFSQNLTVFSDFHEKIKKISKLFSLERTFFTEKFKIFFRKPTIDFERLRHVEPKIRQKFAEKSFEMLVNRHTVPEERVPNPDSFPSFENRNGQISMKMKGKTCKPTQNSVNLQ